MTVLLSNGNYANLTILPVFHNKYIKLLGFIL